MTNLDDALGDWLGQVERIAQMSRADQAKITVAGAKVYADKLREKTKSTHPNRKNSGGKYGHLSDNIGFNGANIDGEKDGSSVVGFNKKAFVARMLNDGTKFRSGDHFVDDAREESRNEVFKAQADRYQQILKKVEGG